MKNKQAFTLIELLVVVLIIGILAAVALPQYQKAVLKTRVAEYEVTMKAIGDAAAVCKLQKGSACTMGELDIDIPECNVIPGVTSSSGNADRCYYNLASDSVVAHVGTVMFVYYFEPISLAVNGYWDSATHNMITENQVVHGFYCQTQTNECLRIGFVNRLGPMRNLYTR